MKPSEAGKEPHRPNRRDFARTAVAGALGAEPLSGSTAKVHPNPPGIKISVQVGSDRSDENLRFVKQLGVGYVNIGTRGEQATAENLRRGESGRGPLGR